MIRAIPIAVLIILLSSCEGGKSKLEDFDGFFTDFISEKEFEIERTSFPLSSYRYEYGVDEKGQEDTAVVETKVGVETFYKQPTLGKYIDENGLIYQIAQDNDETGLRVVKIFKQGTDWLIEYHFQNINGNWVLVSTHDYSL